MFRRRVTAVAATWFAFALAFGLTLAPPAHAKGLGNATLTGPNLPAGGIHIRGDDREVLFEGGFFEEWKMTRSDLDLSDAELGPAYALRMRFLGIGGPKGTIIRQLVYPYADGGPILFTPEQSLGDVEEISRGWTAAPSHYLSMLIRAGLPAPKPASPEKSEDSSSELAGANGDEAPPPAGAREAAPAVAFGGGLATAPWVFVAIGVGVVTILVAVVTVRLRRRPTVA